MKNEKITMEMLCIMNKLRSIYIIISRNSQKEYLHKVITLRINLLYKNIDILKSCEI